MLRTKRTVVALFLLLSGGTAFAADATEKFFFRSGDRIVFLGDSITEQYQYSTDIELYLTTRFPTWGLTFINAGIGGDTAGGGAGRFAEHVLAEKPTAVTINFGMNDAGYGNFDQNRQGFFVAKTEEMLKAAQKAGVRVALVSPNAVDRRVQPRFKLYIETQKQFYAPLKDLAARNGASFVDQYAVTRTALEKMEKDMAAKVIPFGDGFHTSPPGGLFMAHAILTGLHAPALVSDLEIDAKLGKATGKKCSVAGLKSAETSVAFDRTDEALPFPVQKDSASLLPYVNDLKDLNWYGLKIKGLTGARYDLTIDGQNVGSYTTAQLAEGVNLGNLTSGPIYDQANKVFRAISAKNNIVHQRFRGVVMFQPPDWLADVAAERKPKELAKRMKQIEEKQAEVYKLAQPQAHHFELKPSK